LEHKKVTTFTKQIKPLSDKQIKLLKFDFEGKKTCWNANF